MTSCYVVSTENDDVAAVYEFTDNQVSLVNNRAFAAAATNAVSALAIVEDHAPKFLSNHKGISKIEPCELSVGT
jgi:hypothetical protein